MRSSGAPPVPTRSSVPAHATPATTHAATAAAVMIRLSFIVKLSSGCKVWFMAASLEVGETFLLHEDHDLAHVLPDPGCIHVEDVDPAPHRETAVGVEVPGQL